MFNLFRQSKLANNDGKQKLAFKISGMHCVSCSLNIDGALEEHKGVFSASTSYARAISTVVFDPKVTSQKELVKTIHALGYEVTEAI